MKLSYIIIGALMVATLGSVGCAGPMQSSETFPTPMPLDLPIGIDEGLITPGWDGSFPLRLLAFAAHPIGIALDLLIQQPIYLLASVAPEMFGYTVMDEIYQDTTVKYRYHWRQPKR
ncbi:MAG TPA: hypothetical protein VGJ57_04140 [Nitrospirales bacterium]